MNDIVQNVEIVNKAKVLKYESDPGNAEISPALIAELGKVGAVDLQLAGSRCKYPGHQVKQRRFP